MIFILGYGQIGQSISQFYPKESVVFKDKDPLNEEEYKKAVNADVMHVCIPYSRLFRKVVINMINEFKPKLTIIHSTVNPGTTNVLYLKTRANIVYSPVEGRHPNLYSSIKTFTKIISSYTEIGLKLAEAHFKEIGIKTKLFPMPLDAEIGKLLSTSYYGWNILFNKAAYKYCKEKGSNFSYAYEEYNKIYNENYSSIEQNQFVRPILKFMSGTTGGHCIGNNYKILKRKFSLTDIFIRLDKRLSIIQ